MILVEVWFRLRDGRHLCLPRYTQPEAEQALILHLQGWDLPENRPRGSTRKASPTKERCAADQSFPAFSAPLKLDHL